MVCRLRNEIERSVANLRAAGNTAASKFVVASAQGATLAEVR
jgi:hypothetical protein